VRLQCWHTQGTASVRPKCERCDAILASSSALLEECASTGEPTPGTAKEIFGKLFAVPLWSRWPRQCFSLIIPLVQRCNDARDTSLNNALREMLRFRKIILHRDNLPSRTSDSVSPSDLRSWSAPTPARAQVRGLGVVIHDAEDPVHGRSYAADVCPPWLAHTFLQHGDSSICPPKPLAALCALLTASERLRNRRVDNTPAWSYMINGYSSSAPMAEMGNLFHRAIMIAVLGIDCWIEWVNSDANIADLPSR
jgi:hypothetical protein